MCACCRLRLAAQNGTPFEGKFASELTIQKQISKFSAVCSAMTTQAGLNQDPTTPGRNTVRFPPLQGREKRIVRGHRGEPEGSKGTVLNFLLQSRKWRAS